LVEHVFISYIVFCLTYNSLKECRKKVLLRSMCFEKQSFFVILPL